MDKKIRFTEIDLLRFFAAFAVMFFHFTIRGHAAGDALSPVKFPTMALFSKYGYLGVDLFFMISGFVILMTAIDKTARGFVISRMVRLYPAFWACCTLTFLITFFWGTDVLRVSLKRYVANMTMLHGFFPIGHVDGVYWTLFVEMKFYFLVFLLIITKQIHRIEYYFGLWLIFSIVALKYFTSVLDNFLITGYSAYFVAGAVFYLIYRQGITPYRICLLVGSFVLTLPNAAFVLYTKSNWYHMPFSLPVMVAIILSFYVVFLLIALNKTQAIRFDFYLFLGALTYPLYLLHARIGFTLFHQMHLYVNRYVLLLGIMVAVVALSYLVHVLVEKKFSPIFKKWLDAKIAQIPFLQRSPIYEKANT